MHHDATSAADETIDKVRRALGRHEPLKAPPVPPAIPPAVARLVNGDTDLAALFAQRAAELKMIVTPVSSGEAVAKLIDFLRERQIMKVALTAESSGAVARLGVKDALASAGFFVRSWDEITLDELYDDYDCAVTDVDCAVAESGTLVVRPDASHGRGLSLVPMYHVAFVEPKQILPDLVDLFERLNDERYRSNVILISGPSKTADIEMNVVTGVHGPNVVNTFILT